MTDLTVWPLADLDGQELHTLLVAADNDHRLTRPAQLLVRNESLRHRQVQVTTPGGAEANLTVPPASARPTLRHPFAQEPHDTVTGPVGPGLVTYLPSTRGLRVLAFTREEQD